MKFIDKRGMVFGKINIIDLMVALFILSLTPMFYFGWKLYNKPQLQPQLQPQPPPIVKTYEQQYNELLAELEKFEKEVIFEKKLQQLRQMVATQDIELEDLLKGHRIILMPDETK